jgi:hypothetical protein
VPTIFVMYTITLTGNSSELSCDFFPPIEVSKNAKICLLGFQTNNSIPNITDKCNKIGFIYKDGPISVKNDVFTIPTGSYELNEIEAVIKRLLVDYNTSFELRADNNTLKCEMTSNKSIDFSMQNSIGELLGFKNRVYAANINHQSDTLVNITKTNCIYIDSNLAAGSFNNGKQCHTIHEFYPNVPPGYKIIEIPTHLVFYPINSTTITHASIILKNQNNELIDLRGEPISIRLLIQDM